MFGANARWTHEAEILKRGFSFKVEAMPPAKVSKMQSCGHHPILQEQALRLHVLLLAYLIIQAYVPLIPFGRKIGDR